jgi:hypothetical protein
VARIVENVFWLTKLLIIDFVVVHGTVKEKHQDINCNLMGCFILFKTVYSVSAYSFLLDAVGTEDKTQ